MARFPTTADNKPLVSVYPTEGTRKTIVTHNWADPTTWLESSVQVTNEAPSVVTPLLVYELAHNNIIDVYHGKVWAEGAQSSYRVIVETSTDGGVTWVQRTEEDPHVAASLGPGVHGDYYIDYDAGTLTFHSALATGSDVRVSYYYANGSLYTIAPAAGKSLKINRAEVQFTKDIDLTDTVIFEAYGFVEVFAPSLLDTNGGPYPAGTKIPISSTVYKTMRDYYNESSGSYPVYPILGGSSWRGVDQETVILRWDYTAMTDLIYSYGMEIRLYLEHEVAFGGTYATTTLYGISENESI